MQISRGVRKLSKSEGGPLPLSPVEVSEQGGMFLTKIASVLLLIWVALLIIGKGGFIHLLALSSLGLAVVDAVALYRGRQVETTNLTSDFAHLRMDTTATTADRS